jgi:hypothetical protein
VGPSERENRLMIGVKAMRFVIFKGEKNLNDLATRLFHLHGRGSQAATREAADALLKANPQLSDPSKVPVGSLISVPDSAPGMAPAELAVGPSLVSSVTAQTVQAALDALQQRLADIETSATDQMNSGLDRIQTTELKTALKNASDLNPVLADRFPTLDGINKDTKSILKDAQATQDLRKQALTQLKAAVAASTRK